MDNILSVLMDVVLYSGLVVTVASGIVKAMEKYAKTTPGTKDDVFVGKISKIVNMFIEITKVIAMTPKQVEKIIEVEKEVIKEIEVIKEVIKEAPTSPLNTPK